MSRTFCIPVKEGEALKSSRSSLPEFSLWKTIRDFKHAGVFRVADEREFWVLKELVPSSNEIVGRGKELIVPLENRTTAIGVFSLP